MIQGDIVTEAIRKFPNTPTFTIARMVYDNNKEVFKTLEHARSIVRYYRGHTGEKLREKIKSKELFTEEGDNSPFTTLPEGLKHFDEWEPYHLTGRNTLILADIHIPYHDKKALDTALNHGLKKNVDSILFLGDCADFFSVSFFEKDPRKRDMSQEIHMVHEILATIRQAFPEAEIVYKVGNHEERWERYLRVKAPEIIGLEVLNFAEIIKADSVGMTVVSDKRIVKIGKLNCIHGHEFGNTFASPVNPARGLYLKGKETAIGAHYHQTSSHSEKSMTDDITVCWSVGCLCDMRPDYRPINKWNHGLAVVTSDGDSFHVENRRIIDGKVY